MARQNGRYKSSLGVYWLPCADGENVASADFPGGWCRGWIWLVRRCVGDARSELGVEEKSKVAFSHLYLGQDHEASSPIILWHHSHRLEAEIGWQISSNVSPRIEELCAHRGHSGRG